MLSVKQELLAALADGVAMVPVSEFGDYDGGVLDATRSDRWILVFERTDDHGNR